MAGNGGTNWLRVATLNVRGIRMPKRRAAMFLSVRSLPLDILFLQECHLKQEREKSWFSEGWGAGPLEWGVGDGRADGVGILFFSWEFEVESTSSPVPGRVLVVDVRWRGAALRLINVYGPSKLAEREGFLGSIAPILFTNRRVVFGGDFNVSLGESEGGELAQLVASFSLQDPFRALGDGVREYTWQNSRGAASRLDYLFFSARVQLTRYTHVPMWLSDHCMVGVWANLGGGIRRGERKWKFNTTYLKSPVFMEALGRLYEGWRNLRGLFETHGAWWEGVKERVAVFCSCWGRARAGQKRARVQSLSLELQKLWGQGSLVTSEGWERARLLQESLGEIYLEEAEGVLMQAGVRKRVLDERPTRFFFSTVRDRQRLAIIEGLQAEGEIVTDTDKMLQIAAAFYKNLFSDRAPPILEVEEFLESLGVGLSSSDREDLEAPITCREVEEAARSLKGGKVPGVDGLPIEFYRAFFPQLKEDLVKVYQEGLEEGHLPHSMRTGLVTLIYKKGPRENLANWRPITLLAVDYKILAKALTLRLGRVIGSVIHSDQTCGVPGRTGSLNLALIRDCVCWAEQRNLPLALLSIDQEKAFDRVSHRFLAAVLEQLNFGPGFRAWVRLLYEGAVSRVGVNGCLSEPVRQLGGVRQGCPLSPLLYILAIEPLAAALRSEPSLMGLHLPGGKGESAKVSLYADDMTLFLSSDRDFEVANKVILRFSRATGAKVNVTKSSVMFAGRWKGRKEAPGGFSLCADGLKILGVYFHRANSAQANWVNRVRKVKGKLTRWRGRDLSLWGRVEVVRSDLLPCLNHLAYIYPAPPRYERELEKMIFSFVWRSGVELVARAQMCRHLRNGGRGVPCVPLRGIALIVSFTAKLVIQGEEHKAHLLASFWLSFPLRSLIPWNSMRPWSVERPEHYQKVATWIAQNRWCLHQSTILDHRQVYDRLREEMAERASYMRPAGDIEWLTLQESFLVGACKDLNWLAALGRLPVRERLYRHGQSSTSLCPVGCNGEETISHALWSCPGAATMWGMVRDWWEEWGGPELTRERVLYGQGLGSIGKEKRRVVWGVISEGKRALWEWRGSCLRKKLCRIEPYKVFCRLLGRIRKEVQGYKEIFGEESAVKVWGGLPRVGVG